MCSNFKIFNILLFSIILLIPASSISIANISAQEQESYDNDLYMDNESTYFEDSYENVYSYNDDNYDYSSNSYDYNYDPNKSYLFTCPESGIIVDKKENCPESISEFTDINKAVTDNSNGNCFVFGNYVKNESNLTINCININNNLLEETDEDNVPQTGSLTVKKEIFGCDNIINDEMDVMDCTSLNNDSPDWISCDNPNDFSNPDFCQNLPRNFFDIEVLDDQNNQLQLFEGSQQGITIPDLEPGLYSVNEIIHLSGPNQLEESQSVQNNCNNAGFVGGGILETTTTVTLYTICFEYEDQQGNDCTMTTLAAGEAKTCIVKNYMRIAEPSGF